MEEVRFKMDRVLEGACSMVPCEALPFGERYRSEGICVAAGGDAGGEDRVEDVVEGLLKVLRGTGRMIWGGDTLVAIICRLIVLTSLTRKFLADRHSMSRLSSNR